MVERMENYRFDLGVKGLMQIHFKVTITVTKRLSSVPLRNISYRYYSLVFSIFRT